MMREYRFCVADFVFALRLPSDKEVETLLPSFAPFRCDPADAEQPVLRAEVLPYSDFRQNDLCTLLDDGVNDMGHVRFYAFSGGYQVNVSYSEGEPCHYMLADKCFHDVRIYLCWSDKRVGGVLASFLRIAFSQAILPCHAVSVHASTVYMNGKSYLFWGKSGTGKSTHAALWMKHYVGCQLLNDDNPVVRVCGGQVVVYGTPWSGKTPCYKNMSFPVQGMVRLYQAQTNKFVTCRGIDAFVALIPGCAVITSDHDLYDHMCDTIASIVQKVRVGVLHCRPDVEAAEVCLGALVNNGSIWSASLE